MDLAQVAARVVRAEGLDVVERFLDFLHPCCDCSQSSRSDCGSPARNPIRSIILLSASNVGLSMPS